MKGEGASAIRTPRRLRRRGLRNVIRAIVFDDRHEYWCDTRARKCKAMSSHRMYLASLSLSHDTRNREQEKEANRRARVSRLYGPSTYAKPCAEMRICGRKDTRALPRLSCFSIIVVDAMCDIRVKNDCERALACAADSRR